MKNIFKEKRFKYGINALILTISIIGIIILINVLLTKYSFRKDITSAKTFELSEQTKSVISSLDKSGKVVNVYLFTAYVQPESDLDQKTKDIIEKLLNQYERSSKNFKYRKIDIFTNPSLAQKYGIANPYEVAFEINGISKVVALQDIFSQNGFVAEQAYTNAIMSVMNENPPIVYFVQGHKEMNIDKQASILKAFIEREGYVIKTVNVGLEGKVPDDASMIINIGPSTEFTAYEIDILKSYFDGGGKGLFLANSFYNNPQMSNINGLFKYFGVDLNNDIVLDPQRKDKAINFVVPEYGDNEIVNKLKEIPNYYAIMADSRSINILQNGENINIIPILKSSSEAWGENSIEEINSASPKFDDNEIKGVSNLGAYITKTIDDNKQAKIIVYGTDLIADNTIIQKGANIDLMLNSVAALSGVKESITIRPKEIDVKTIQLLPIQRTVIVYLLTLILPGLILISGLIIWLRRRHL